MSRKKSNSKMNFAMNARKVIKNAKLHAIVLNIMLYNKFKIKRNQNNKRN